MIYEIIYLTTIGLPTGGIFAHKQYTEQHNRHKQYIEQNISLIRKSADRAPSLRVIRGILAFTLQLNTLRTG